MGEHPDESPTSGDPPPRAGGNALAFGLLAAICAAVPVIGDVLVIPPAVLAIVFGVIGVGHYDAGRSPRLLPSLLGAGLGALAALFTAVGLLAAGPLG